LNLGECSTRFLLGAIAAAQLLSLAIDHAGIDRELVAHNSLAPCAAF
jgi:hypothetical protein